MKLLGVLLLACPVWGQTICAPTPAFSLCEIGFAATGAADLQVEFRSPGHKTYLVGGFWDGVKIAVRVTPTEPGLWDFRVVTGIAAYSGKTGQFVALPSDHPGLIEVANVHHFRYSASRGPHLWMGAVLPSQASVETIEERARQKFNHMRVTLVSGKAVPFPDQAAMAALDKQILAMNRLRVTADLAIAPRADFFADRAEREKAVRYLVARYGAMNVTWQGFEEFESAANGREILKETGALIDSLDAYHHLQTTGTSATSGPLLEDGWMKVLSFRSAEVAAVEHQVYGVPALMDVGAGAGDFVARLWSSAMTGAYPETAVPEGGAAGRAAKAWFEFFAGTRHWELEPFFDVQGGEGLALEGVEYVIFVAKAGPVSVTVEKHTYDVEWMNAATGETVAGKNLKTEVFNGETPGGAGPWVLHLSREGHKSSMLKSYKFESREVLTQEVEVAKIPFEVVQPAGDSLSLSAPGRFEAKIRKETNATRTMRYVWTGEVTADGQSYRVIGTGARGTFEIPANIAPRLPALLHLRVTAMNANGKLYVVDRNYQLTQ